jgi:hypothetical protein
MNGFPKAAELDICRRFLFTVCSDFQTPVQVATSVFQTSFHDGVGGPRENGQESVNIFIEICTRFIFKFLRTCKTK